MQALGFISSFINFNRDERIVSHFAILPVILTTFSTRRTLSVMVGGTIGLLTNSTRLHKIIKPYKTIIYKQTRISSPCVDAVQLLYAHNYIYIYECAILYFSGKSNKREKISSC